MGSLLVSNSADGGEIAARILGIVTGGMPRFMTYLDLSVKTRIYR